MMNTTQTSLKLYSNGPSDPNSGLVKVTAKVLGIEYIEVDITTIPSEAAPVSKKAKSEEKVVPSPLDKIRSKTLTGKFPLLETPEGFTIFEATSIAKYFARQRHGFYGSNDFESK